MGKSGTLCRESGGWRLRRRHNVSAWLSHAFIEREREHKRKILERLGWTASPRLTISERESQNRGALTNQWAMRIRTQDATEASRGSHHEKSVAVAAGHYVLYSLCKAPFVGGLIAAVSGEGALATAIGGLTSTGSGLRL